jgi:hypothetical protein
VEVEFEMSRVEEIAGQVKDLSSDELKAFRDWFGEFDAELWDAQIEADARNGKLRPRAEPAPSTHRVMVRDRPV